MKTMNFVIVLSSSALITLLFTGCEPKEIITVVAPAGTSYNCSVDNEAVGSADKNGLRITVEPGNHTVSWLLSDQSQAVVPVNFPFSEDYLDLLLNMGSGTVVYLYNGALFADEAPRWATISGTLSYGEQYDRQWSYANDYAQISGTLTCSAGEPGTFRAEVQVSISQ